MAQYLQENISSRQKKNELSRLVDQFDILPITNQTDLTVLEALLQLQPATRASLCEKTGIPRTTIYDALTRLILKRIVTKYSVPGRSKGRPKVYYKTVNPVQ
ncbi:MAG: helix-turn-helix domain-containing protein [Candidatus Heimdallarchaeota archaeon]